MFPDFPFDCGSSSFLPHPEVRRYLESYCLKHHVRPRVRVGPAAPRRLMECCVSLCFSFTLLSYVSSTPR